ncbi:aluminum-activated malate transporter 8-like [Cucumis melo var. makuwa]|uniref:Aluminum-activated malate transporter 8-like n=2 Tax=Cucumis melo TaxID=3656 RepID=A0A1S3B7M1_CUCME|nr:aluminum-activated malate transporter 8-like [Cucumis melo]KAA0043811.1 aluminum-activated malate transporter 8-like [Cucumis melo var. makuwa]TYK25321.1 aluminum-activated malate transporter 8-like [Cucumis melo var. makuwa]
MGIQLKNKAMEVALKIKKLGQDDPRRIIHSIKVGVALTLVSLFYYWKPLYDGFGASGIWAVITVVVIFEFTVGATLSKGLNRGLGTMLAGALGVGVDYLANLSGQKGEPFVLGIFVFLIAASATFSRFFPGIKARYDYGVLIFILTFSMVSVSGYRVDEFLTMAHQRLTTILVGGAICIIISIVVCPVWAGETLHNSIISNINKLANYLEGFGGEYFHSSDEHVTVPEKDKSFLQEYKVVLNSKSTEDSMANFARWEPRHGNFGFRHPWKHYLKIGSFARQCAYHIEALNFHLSPHQLQEPSQFRRMMEVPCKTISSESGKALKALATAMKTMTDPSPSSQLHLNAAKSAVNDLKNTLKSGTAQISDDISNLLAIIPDATVASILIDIVKSVEDLSEAVAELSLKAKFKSVSPEKPQLLHKGTIKPFVEEDDNEAQQQPHVVITVSGIENNNNNEDLPVNKK